MKTIAQYRREGYKVRVMHGRVIGKNGEIQPKGGLTVIELTTPDGKTTVKGEAECHPKDAFVRKLGNVKALGRAIGALKETESADPYYEL